MRQQIGGMMARLAYLQSRYHTEPEALKSIGEMILEFDRLPDHPHLRTARQILAELKRQKEAHQPTDVAGELREAHENLSLYLRTVAGPQTGVGGAPRDDL